MFGVAPDYLLGLQESQNPDYHVCGGTNEADCPPNPQGLCRIAHKDLTTTLTGNAVFFMTGPDLLPTATAEDRAAYARLYCINAPSLPEYSSYYGCFCDMRTTPPFPPSPPLPASPPPVGEACHQAIIDCGDVNGWYSKHRRGCQIYGWGFPGTDSHDCMRPEEVSGSSCTPTTRRYDRLDLTECYAGCDDVYSDGCHDGGMRATPTAATASRAAIARQRPRPTTCRTCAPASTASAATASIPCRRRRRRRLRRRCCPRMATTSSRTMEPGARRRSSAAIRAAGRQCPGRWRSTPPSNSFWWPKGWRAPTWVGSATLR